MSRIGKLPIKIPAGVKIDLSKTEVKVEGPKGKLSMSYIPAVSFKEEDGNIILERKNDEKKNKSLHGLYRVLLSNMVTGVTKGFEKKLEINGTGYRANVQGKKLVLSIGYSHPVEFDIPEGININIDDNTKVTVSGIDKQLVGHVATVIRSKRPVEPYKGKGIKFVDERVIRKAGKAAK